MKKIEIFFGKGVKSVAMVGGVTGGVSSAIQGKGFKAGFTAGLLPGAISGAITGGICGYNKAIEQGRDPWTGSDYPKKWNRFYNDHIEYFQDELCSQSDNTDQGELKSRSMGKNAGADTKPAKYIGNNDEGYERYNSKTYISRKLVKDWYSDPQKYEGTVLDLISHESQHVADYYSGYDSNIKYNNDYYNAIMEYRAYSYQYSMWGSDYYKIQQTILVFPGVIQYYP